MVTYAAVSAGARWPPSSRAEPAWGRGAARGGPTPSDASGITIPALGGDLKFTGGIGAFRGVISPRRIGALTDATVGAPDEQGSEALLARYGWPAETAAMRTFEAMREELTNVPTSLAFYRTSDVAAADAVPVPA